jgi:hypothetical protein
LITRPGQLARSTLAQAANEDVLNEVGTKAKPVAEYVLLVQRVAALDDAVINAI